MVGNMEFLGLVNPIATNDLMQSLYKVIHQGLNMGKARYNLGQSY
jgi:hypothetical protein